MKKNIIASGFLAVLILFSSCGIKSDTAKATLVDFLTCVSEERYEDAAALMHADAETTAEELKNWAEELESKTGADLSNGLEIDRYTGFYTSVGLGSSSYELTAVAVADGCSFDVEYKVVENENGYGIYGITFNLNATV